MKGKTNALVGEPKKKYVMTTIRIDQNISDPATMITRIVDEGGIESIRANSHRYTGTFADGVMTLKQLDDNDGTKYLDGTSATLTTIGTDVWMKLPKFYWKCTEHATDIWDFSVAYGGKPDDTFKEWDGKDLIGAYEAYVSSSKLYSASGKISTGNVSQANFKTYSRNRGEGFTLVKWKHHCMMAMLFYSMYNHTDSQEKVGYGTNSYSKTTGQTNSLGMSDTVGGGNGDTMSINFWGLENWWGNRSEWIDNVEVSNNSFNINDDENTRSVNFGSLSDGFFSKIIFGDDCDLVPKVLQGSSSTGYCDYCFIASRESSNVVYRCGDKAWAEGGITHIDLTLLNSEAKTNTSSRLAFRGEIVIES